MPHYTVYTSGAEPRRIGSHDRIGPARDMAQASADELREEVTLTGARNGHETFYPAPYPRRFAHVRSVDGRPDWTPRTRSREVFDRMSEEAEELTPADAVRLAQRLLVAVDDAGIAYGDFASAQAVTRYVRRAIGALRGLSLS